MRLTRRTLLGTAAALAAGEIASAALAAPAAPDSSQSDFIKVRGALDQSLVIGFLSGRYRGVVDGEARPLFGVEAATFSRYRYRDNGYDSVWVGSDGKGPSGPA